MTRRLTLLIACLALTMTAFAPAPVYKGSNRPSGRFIVMKTSLGTIEIELYEKRAPISVQNFLAYVDAKHYDGTVFHRVIPNFMIQGGGYEKGLGRVNDAQGVATKQKKTRAAIKNESSNGLRNLRGTLAMARTAAPDSGTAQFFINVKANSFLDRHNVEKPGYCVFGRVVAGMDVIDKIQRVKTKTHFDGFADVPVDEVVVESVTRRK